MYEMKLDWKDHNLNLNAVETWLRSNADNYTGSLAVGNGSVTHESGLHLYFSTEPDQENKDAINSYWDNLDEESDEAQSYQSSADLEADKLTKKSSGKAKLIALGLTEDEASALVG